MSGTPDSDCESKPLCGLRIAVTRPRHQAEGLIGRLESLGAEVLQFPTIEILPLSDPEPLDDALRRLPDTHWVIFTSVNAVDAVLARLAAMGMPAGALSAVKVCAIGPATAERLCAAKVSVDLMPARYTAQGILAEMERRGDVRGRRFLLPRADIAPEALTEGLRRLGAETIEVAAYRTVPAGPPPDEMVRRLLDGEVSFITFTSSSTVESFVRILGRDRAAKLPATVRCASIGPTTSATLREHGLPVSVEAEPHTIDGLVEAIAKTAGR
jgi:uroporphyrinogen-III synthase